MKKILLKTFVMCFVMLLCSFLVAFDSVDNSAQFVKTKYFSIEDNTYFVIESYEELEKYYSENESKYGFNIIRSESLNFKDAIQNYDEEFFANNNLVIVLLNATSGSKRHKLTNCELEDGTLNLEIKIVSPEYCTDDMASWHVLVQVEKAPINDVKVDIKK